MQAKCNRQPVTNVAFEEVTNQMESTKGKYQTATQVKVLSPVIFNVKNADSFHMLEGCMNYLDKVRDSLILRGLSPWYDIEWKLQELGRPKILPIKGIFADNPERRECGEGILGVGLTHSRGVTGVMSCEMKNHSKGLALSCKDKVKHSLITELEELWKRN
jgi:hypothetical protein